MTPQTVQIAAALVIPVLTSLISSPRWPRGVRAALAFILCAALAIWQAHGQFGPDVIENIFKVFALVQGLYLGLLKHIGLPALEEGSADAWTKLWAGLSAGLNHSGGDAEPEAPSVEVRLARLSRLLQAQAITQAEYDTRRSAILEEV